MATMQIGDMGINRYIFSLQKNSAPTKLISAVIRNMNRTMVMKLVSTGASAGYQISNGPERRQ